MKKTLSLCLILSCFSFLTLSPSQAATQINNKITNNTLTPGPSPLAKTAPGEGNQVASVNHPPSKTAPGEGNSQTIVTLDADQDNKITLESIADGTDDIFLRTASKREIKNLPDDSTYFEDDVGHFFLPLTYEELHKADSNGDRRINNKDPMYAGIFVGRFQPNSKQEIISLASLKEVGITSIILLAAIPAPTDKHTNLEAVTKDGTEILVQPTKWKF